MDKAINVYRGRSGQLWYELQRDERSICLLPEYGSKQGHLMMPLAFFERCGFMLVGTCEQIGDPIRDAVTRRRP